MYWYTVEILIEKTIESGTAKIEARTYRKQARIYCVIYSLLATDTAVYDIHNEDHTLADQFVKLYGNR